jgi:hypothetical protein
MRKTVATRLFTAFALALFLLWGSAQASETFTKHDAISIEKRALAKRFGESYPKGRTVSNQCYRRSWTKYQCFPAWRFKRYLYQGILNLRASGSYRGHIDRWVAKCFPDRCLPNPPQVKTYRLVGKL